MTDAPSALLRGLNVLHLPSSTLEHLRCRDWASATFTGTRHEIVFRLEGEWAGAEADAFLDGLAEREFDLRGHILADIALISQTRTSGAQGPLVRIAIEALTVEDA